MKYKDIICIINHLQDSCVGFTRLWGSHELLSNVNYSQENLNTENVNERGKNQHVSLGVRVWP